MKDIDVYTAAINTTKASYIDLILARILGSKIQIQYEERRKKSRRKNAAIITVTQIFEAVEYKGKTYLLDNRLTDRRIGMH